MNIGVIGAGEWGRNHVRVLTELIGAEHVRVAEMDTNQLQMMQQMYKVSGVPDYKNLLSDTEITAIHVCTPSSTHYRICKEILEAEKSVLCEKPLSLNSSDCKKLVELADKRKLTLMVGHIFRYHKLTQELKDLVTLGKLGKIFFIKSERLGLRTPRPDCGVIFDFAIHDVDMACYLTGFDYPEEVWANAFSYLPHEVEDLGLLTLRFQDQTVVHIDVSWLTPRKIRAMTIVGREKSVFADFVTSQMQVFDAGVIPQYYDYSRFRLITREGPTRETTVRSQEPLKVEIQHFLDCLSSGKEPKTGGLVGRRAVEIIESAYYSAKKNRSVRIKNDI
jgi:predicted dehydrogenase